MRPRVLIVSLCIVLLTILSGRSVGAERVLTIAQGIHPETLDPHANRGLADSRNIFGLVTEPFVVYDFDRGRVVGWLAESWTRIGDRTWQFKVRKGVRFTNGEELTAETVKMNFERMMDPKQSPVQSSSVRDVSGVEVVDKYTLNVNTKVPSPLLAHTLVFFYVAPKYLWQVGAERFVTSPIGSGPYKFVREVRDDRVELVANPNYWGGKPNVDRVIFRAIPETSSRTAALVAGEVDIASRLGLSDVPLVKRRANLDVVATPGLRVVMIMLDQRRYVELKDPRVRKALNYAVDKEAIVKNLLEGYGVVLQGQVATPEYVGFHPGLKAYPYDPEKARQLLREAGYATGLSIQLVTPIGRYVKDKEIAEFVVAQWRAIGVDARVNAMETAVYFGGAPGTIVHQSSDPPVRTPLAFFVGLLFAPEAGLQLRAQACDFPSGHYCNPSFDEIVFQALRTFDRSIRVTLSRQASEFLYEDPSVVFLHQQTTVYGRAKRVSGWRFLPDELLDLKSVITK